MFACTHTGAHECKYRLWNVKGEHAMGGVEEMGGGNKTHAIWEKRR